MAHGRRGKRGGQKRPGKQCINRALIALHTGQKDTTHSAALSQACELHGVVPHADRTVDTWDGHTRRSNADGAITRVLAFAQRVQAQSKG